MENLFLNGIDISSICIGGAEILQLVGYILMAFKIGIPILIVAYGIFDFGKAVTASKDDEIKKSAKTLGMRALAGVIIFFVPTIVMWVFGLIPEYAKDADTFDYCKECILSPRGDKCEQAIAKGQQ